MRIPRLTTRRLMLIVAISAAVATVPVMRRRSQEFRVHAYNHRLIMDQSFVSGAETEKGPVGAAELMTLNRLYKSYHERMIEKYEWGSRYPWLPVTADRVDAVTGGLERGYVWFNLHCPFGGPGMQDISRGSPRSGRCPFSHRYK